MSNGSERNEGSREIREDHLAEESNSWKCNTFVSNCCLFVHLTEGDPRSISIFVVENRPGRIGVL